MDKVRSAALQKPKAVLQVQDLQVYYGESHALQGVSLTLERGMRLGLIGPAASGKSVLLKMIRGLEPPSGGQIELLGANVVGTREAELGELRKRAGMLFQNYALFDFLTVADNVEFRPEQRGVPEPTLKARSPFSCCSAAATVAAAMSRTWMKSRRCLPSSYTAGARPERSADSQIARTPASGVSIGRPGPDTLW